MLHKKKDLIILFSKIILGVGIPFIISSVYLFFEGNKTIFDTMPSWNDEDFYYNQIKAILEYGQPLGHYGYDGSHASIGNFGYHGFIILTPYVIYAFIFGLKFYSITLVNIGLLAICNIIYIALFKPSFKQIIYFGVFTLSPMVLFYINTSMMEGENYFFAIISALLMTYILQRKRSKKVLVILGLLIIWAVLSKVTWAVLIFPYVMIVLEEKRQIPLVFRCVIAGLVTILLGGSAYIFFLFCQAEYFKGYSLIDQYIERIELSGLLDGLILIWNTAIEKFRSTWLMHSSPWNWIDYCGLFVLIILILSLLFVFLEYRNGIMAYIPSIVVLGFLIGVSIVYYSGGGPAIRTVYASAVFAQAFIIIILQEANHKLIRQGVFLLFGICFIVGFVIQNSIGFDPRNYYERDDEPYYAEIEKYMSGIEIDVTAEDPWENTLVIATNSYPDRIYELFAPTGIGLNYYLDIPTDLSDFKAEYVLLSNENLEDLDILEGEGYMVLERDDLTTLLRHMN